MSLLCGKNPALEAVNAIRDQIKAKLADKKSALGGIASQVSAITSKISELKAKVTNLDSFQAELAALVGADPAKIAAFKEKWKGKVAELDALVAKATSGISDALDFCKDVPNIKMDPTTGSTVQEAKESPTPNAAPAEPEPVKETVVVNTEKVSTGNSGVVPDDIESKFKTLIQAPFQEQVRSILHKDAFAKTLAEANLKNSPGYKEAVLKRKTWTSDAELEANADSSEELELIRLIRDATLKRRAADIIKKTVDNYFKFSIEKKLISSDLSLTEVQYWKQVKEIGNTAIKLADPGDPIYSHMQDIRPWLTKTDEILNANSQVVIDYAKYQNNAS